ncbi:PREDICTED: WUSCHEL-related homeobox 11 isoform X1 [Theobroma cacao]|uniref:WUSCHEL-related homeobox 11 isoform X1 n=1 Tax=Theobroma cacao TaxID=3641 RepID=A0AB32WFQ6_THECC|nr:PREDICTED: WUSCHEL-related homeobox 11 isoform X1 [Theobroma cacao]
MCFVFFSYILNLGFSFKTIFFLLLFFITVMEDQASDPNSPSHGSERSEPVRSRWTPKPEQILILESIFNSGMVNPPKDETVRIRKLLEKFGSVGDANVFYWFQNRRSRSRRRQRQLQASLAGDHQQRNQAQVPGGAIQYENSTAAMGFANCPSFANSSPSSFLVGSSSSCGVMGDDGFENLLSMSGQMGFQEIGQSSSVTSVLCPSETSNLHYQSASFSGFITVFINGVPTEVPRGPLDMKAMFGQDVVLVHSSGVPVPMNEFGFLLQSLQPGESYFLVSSFGR